MLVLEMRNFTKITRLVLQLITNELRTLVRKMGMWEFRVPELLQQVASIVAPVLNFLLDRKPLVLQSKLKEREERKVIDVSLCFLENRLTAEEQKDMEEAEFLADFNERFQLVSGKKKNNNNQINKQTNKINKQINKCEKLN